MYVKVCGITRPADAELAVSAGADAIGILLYTDSPRSVTPRRAETILKSIEGRVETVCVTTTRSPAYLREICSLRPDAIQTYHPMHVPDRFISVSGWDGISPPPGDADRLLLDASHGRGLLLDTAVAQAAIAEATVPVVISGGLTPSSVVGVIQSLHPAGVDVSSGVESSPGVKDMHRMQAFVAACRGSSR
ncbi:phosphoribosylanthranilate isomerase [Methanocalculus taiwanensis]|uniref:N-(5'-phosphoribosyl)anthranilate isomerase n=1 Tax=Methanocalculus taiwanensis TaxID=106207 RepID=A0ABD4TGU8_9EURY|nr:phosphoribosylanthranilate isomerase [Methanocalculus taiwanensis]MCQ1537512.1 phosphoribosylanthranilate isomerase [Methanocalculus taiwanensis]